MSDPRRVTRAERLMEALKRDLATLAGPPEYVSERKFYEDRIVGYREVIAALVAVHVWLPR